MRALERRALERDASRRLRLPSSTSRAREDLPEPDTPVMTVKRPSGMRASTSRKIVQSRADDLDRGRVAVDRAAQGARMAQRRREAAAGGRIARRASSAARALRHQAAAASAGAGTQIDHVIGAADGVLVVLDHDQGIALGAQPVQGIEQASRCRADADRWSARPARSTRPADWTPAAPPAECAALRRPKGSGAARLSCR